jgi:hypothetical protein
MPEHVRMHFERHASGFAEPADEMVKSDGGHRAL